MLLSIPSFSWAKDGDTKTGETEDGDYHYELIVVSESAKTARVSKIEYKSSILSSDFDGGEVKLGATVKTNGILGMFGTTYTIVGIDEGAFKNSAPNNAVTAIDLTACTGITSIPDSCFSRCKTVLAIGLPTTVTSIGKGAFYACSALKQVTCNDYNANGTATDYNLLPSGITKIDDGAFDNCSKLTNIYLPTSLRTIGERSFAVTINMKTVRTSGSASFPAPLTTIGKEAFSNSGVTSVTLQGNVTSIGNDAFQRCTNLKSVDVGTGVTAIPENCFAYDTSLQEVNIRKTQSIGKYAFYQCGFKSINLYNQVESSEFLKSIGYGAFQSCTALETIKFPSTLTSVGGNDFGGCNALKIVDATKLHDPSIFVYTSFTSSQHENTRLYVSFGDEVAYHNSTAFKDFKYLIADVTANFIDEVVANGTVGYHYRLRNDITGYASKYATGNNIYATTPTHQTTTGPAEGDDNYYSGIKDLSDKGYSYDRNPWIEFRNVGNFTGANIGFGRTFELVDKTNPAFEFASGFDLYEDTYEPVTTIETGNFDFDYTPNTYCPANFVPQSKYAFIEPQPNELATIKWAVYAGDGKFYVPAKQIAAHGYYNEGNIEGGFTINTALNSELTFTPGCAYNITAIIKRAESSASAPQRAISYNSNSLSSEWEVFPTAINSVIENVTTGIDAPATGADVVGVIYYNAAGVAAATPWKGVNIVVSTHADGKISTVKRAF